MLSILNRILVLVFFVFSFSPLAAQCETEIELIGFNCGIAPSTVFVIVQVERPSQQAEGWRLNGQNVVWPFDTIVDLGGLEGSIIELSGEIVGDANCELRPLVLQNPCFDSTNCPLELIVAEVQSPSCGATDGSITFEVNNASPPFVIEYNGPGGPGRLEGELTATGLAAGDYVFELVDATDFCTRRIEYSLNSESDLAGLIQVEANCGEATLTVTEVTGGTPPYSFEWINGSTEESIVVNTSDRYFVDIIDEAGCVVRVATQVSLGQSLFLFPDSISVTDASCGLENGSIFPFVSGGTAPYAYAWSNGSTNANLFDLTPGNYSLTVTDQEGCFVTQEYVVGDNGELFLFPFPENPLLCGPGTTTRIGIELAQNDAQIIWRNPAGEVVGETFDLEVSEPGIYEVTVVIGNCEETREIEVGIQDSDNGGMMIRRLTTNDSVGLNCGPFLVFGEQNFVRAEWTVPNGETFFTSGVNSGEFGPGLYIARLYTPNFNCPFIDSTLVLPEELSCGNLTGQVFVDEDGNCTRDIGENTLADQLVEIDWAGSDFRRYYAYTDEAGSWSARVPGGSYTIRVISPNDLFTPCIDPNVYTVAENQETSTVPLGLFAEQSCPRVTVDLNIPLLRRCFENPVYLSYENTGSTTAEDVQLTVQIEAFADEVSPFFEPLPSSILEDEQTGIFTVTWSLGDLEPFEGGRLGLIVFSCNNEFPLGAAACISATAEPNNPCPPADPMWSGASVRVNGECQGDSVVFSLRNVGDASMTEGLSYVVVEDGVILSTIPGNGEPLGAGEELLVNLPADGATYHLRAMQEPFHPGLEMPIDFVEGCGGEPGSLGFALQFPVSDDAYWIDEDCLPLIGSYDPNDKQAEPRGYGEDRFIEADQPIDYLIRFQNTGTDTAFLVVIRDTLSERLDLSTFELLSSTHRVETKIDSMRGISFIFQDIMLVDSFTNEPGSHGAVSFRIRPQLGLEPGTVIPNDASIYFDFNDPIVTNSTRHTVEKGFVVVGLLDFSPELLDLGIYPNPTAGPARLQLPESLRQDELRLDIFDAMGRHQRTYDYRPGQTPSFTLGDMPPGLYTLRLSRNALSIGSGRVLLQRP